MKKEFVCISCPVGCRLTVWEDEDGAVQVQGNTCPRGKAYGVQEFTAPMRTVTSSVPVQHGEQLMCSVKTDAPVPKARIPEVLAAIRRAGVRAPCAWATASSRTSQAPAQTSWPQGALQRKSAKEKASGGALRIGSAPPFVFAPLSGAGVAQARTRPPPQTAALPRQRAGTSGRRSTRRTRG